MIGTIVEGLGAVNSSRLIGIDIDGVLSDIVVQFSEYASELFGEEISTTDVVSEDIETCTKLSRDQLVEIFRTRQFFQTMPVIDCATDSLHRLKKAGWRTVLMTDRFWYPEIKDDTLVWLQENEIPYESLYFVGKAEKANVSSELGIRIFVEDQLSNARLLAKVCERVFLINRPYNQGIVQSPIVRVSSLSEAGSSLWAPSNQKRFASLSS